MWYEPDNTWLARVAISVPTTAAAASGDVDVVIPASFLDFWDAIDASGAELRVVTAAGALVAYAVDNGSGGAFNKTSKLGRLRLDGVTLPNLANSVTLFYLYYKASSAQASAAVAVTMTSVLTGYIELAGPSGVVVVHEDNVLRQRKPRYTLVKRASEQRAVWFDFGGSLSYAIQLVNEEKFWEEPWYATYRVVDITESAQATMVDAPSLRFVVDEGRVWLKCPVLAGTDETNYTLHPLLRTVYPGGTVEAQKIESAVGVRVEDSHYES